jgi:hypothetical protein
MKYTASLHIDLWGNTWCLLWFWNQPSKSVFQWKPESFACQSECSSLLYTSLFFLCFGCCFWQTVNIPIEHVWFNAQNQTVENKSAT